MKNTIKILIIAILLGIIASVSANPLYVDYTEKYDISAVVSGSGTTYNSQSLTGYITINNTATSVGDTLSDVWVAVNISNNITGLILVSNTTGKEVFLKNSAPAYANLPTADLYIHIPVLPNGTVVQYKFGIDTSSVGGVPVGVDESYSATKVPSNRESNWTVYMDISRDTSALPSTDTSVNVNVSKYLSNDPANFGDSTWNLLRIDSASASQGTPTIYDGPYFTGTNDSLDVTGITLDNTQNASISFTVVANNTYTGRGITLADYGFAVIEFSFPGTVSGSEVKGVYASGKGIINAVKDGPYKNTTTGEYTLWYMNGTVGNKADSYSFNLTNTNIWAVDGGNPTILDPFNNSLLISGSSHALTPNTILNPGENWSTTTYNFTFDGVPVVWANSTFTVVNDNITLLNQTVNEYDSAYGSSYIIVEQIYVIGSYLIKVTKHIIPNADGTYTIYIVVENIGSENSPFVYAYDLIPSNFSIVGNITVNDSSMLNNTGNHSVSNPNYNMSIYWALNPLTGGADGDGNYTDATEITNHQTVVISYVLNGTGEFNPTDAFIVGIDPTHSLLPTTSPKTILTSGVMADNFEPIIILLSALVGLGILIRRK